MFNSITRYRSIKSKVTTHSMPLLLLCIVLFSPVVNAQYTIEVVSPPEAEFTQTFGINNAGKVTGGANTSSGSFAFIYDSKRGTYETISEDLAALEISNSGVIVGSVDNDCAIRDKKGNVTLFFPPSYTEESTCQARGVNSRGDVSGYIIDAEGQWSGFIHDPKKGTFEEFLPSLQTIAHAINAKGQNAGSVFLSADEAFPGSVPGRYGYVREKSGSVKYFAVDETQGFPGQTRARGISESGLVTGFYIDAESFDTKSFVTVLTDGNAFDLVTLADEHIIFQSPCDDNLPPPPGPGYELSTDFTSSQVRNDGVVVGTCSDTYFNPMTGDLISASKGFIATPN